MKELDKNYNSKIVEKEIYKTWKKSGFFNPDKLPGKRNQTYSVVIPPPNITGKLHMGHALNTTTQDILIRRKRMQGFKTLWIPGTDHAGIATQNVMEKQLKKEGLTRFDLGREKFIERIWDWKKEYQNIILEQLEKIGISCDWSRTRFTMDKDYRLAVKKSFDHYYKKGWIYKGKRTINWCPRCQTSLSNLELEYKNTKGKLWYIKYSLSHNPKLFIVVATTRPETMLGDTAIAVNPKDQRFENLIGKKAILPIVEREIPIIADRLIDSKFGTGAVKITPAHDMMDYKISLKHNLEIIPVIDKYGKITNQAPKEYQGLSIFKAREKIVSELEEKKLIEKVEDYEHSVPKCARCSTTIELIPSDQWFLKMSDLSKLAYDPVKNDKIKFHPKRWKKVYLDWLKNVDDWCISRQIWWGHQLPIKDSGDVLDTWFSSALWPFATLGWPKKTKELKDFYPADVVATARDIINLWVVRMIFSGKEFTEEIPFKNVYIHPTVLTKDGKRMSKSLGTGIDPIELIEEYGADAMRFGITYQITEMQDIKFSKDSIVMGKKFCNKIWNASRFVLLQIKNTEKIQLNLKLKNPTMADKKVLKDLNKTIKLVDKYLEDFLFGKAAHCLYNFFWHDFCDKYIEKSKKQKDKKQTNQILFYVLLNSLKLLHPFVPFVTEEIYQNLAIKKKMGCLMVEKWPIVK